MQITELGLAKVSSGQWVPAKHVDFNKLSISQQSWLCQRQEEKKPHEQFYALGVDKYVEREMLGR